MTTLVRTTLLLLGALVVSACAVSPAIDNRNTGTEGPIAIEGIQTAAQAMAQGDRLLNAGALDQAIKHYLLALQLEPDSADAMWRIGLVHDDRGDDEMAGSAYARALKLNPGHAGALEGRGILLLRNRQHAEAQAYLERAFAADPSRLRARNGLGVLADLDGRHADAVEHYQAVLAITPDAVSTIVNLGYSRYLSGAWPEAERQYRHALTLSPTHAGATQNLGLLLVRQDRFDDALRTLGRVMSLADAHNDIGYTLMLGGDYDAAARYFSEAIRLSPTYFETAQENLAHNRRLRRQGEMSATTPPARVATVATMPVRDAKAARIVGPDRQPTHENPKIDMPVPLRAEPVSASVNEARALNDRRWVSAPALRVREDASASAGVLDHLARGQVVRVLSTRDDWAYIRYWQHASQSPVQRRGWVHGMYLSDSRLTHET